MRTDKGEGIVNRRAERPGADRAAGLIREILKDAGHDGPTVPGPASDPVTVVIEREVDGFNYLLVRAAAADDSLGRLSPREQEIVRLVAKGHPNKIIADVMDISCWTVSTYLRRIFAKLGVASRAAMVAKMMSRLPVDR